MRTPHTIHTLPSDLLAAHQTITELRLEVARLKALAMLDPLTGIANRRAFDEDLASAFARSKRTGSPLSVAVIDLDNFKIRNDHHGHAEGDRCLKSLAAQLVADSRRGDTAARIGGEEFALVLPDTTDAQAAEICKRIASNVRSRCGGADLTFSAGIAQIDGTMADACTILDYADSAMYTAKHNGKDQVAIHERRFRRSVYLWKR